MFFTIRSDVVAPTEVAEMFSIILRELLLLEHNIIVSGSEHRDPHQKHPVESALNHSISSSDRRRVQRAET